MPERSLPLPFALDLHRSMRPIQIGAHDPTVRLDRDVMLRASRTPLGTATVRVEHHGDRLQVEAWGDGAEWALDAAPAALGLLDTRAGFDPQHPVVRDLHRHADGLRLPSTGRVIEALVPAVLSQKVTGFEARRSFRQLVDRWGEPAPGPGGLHVPPAADVVAELGYYELHVLGVEKKRADTLKRVCAHATRLEAAGALTSQILRDRLEAIPGVGRWTSAEVARLVVGDADAVSVGDFHLKNVVAFNLAGEPRATDDRMLELLQPFAGHRGRVCLLIASGGTSAPKYGPRKRIEPIAGR